MMKNKQKLFLTGMFGAVFLFVGGAFSVNAQDLIILRDGNVIEAKVVEIAPSEIRYKRFDNLDGPMYVIPVSNVLSIRYENGTLDIISGSPITGQGRIQADGRATMMDPEKLTFGLSLDPTGFLLFGPSLNAEFTKGHLNTQIRISVPWLGLLSSTGGIGGGLALNYFWHSRIGGFYLGGLVEFSYITPDTLLGGTYPVEDAPSYPPGYTPESSYNSGNYVENLDDLQIIVAANAGYKFVLSSGMYFRVGANVGVSFGVFWETVDFLIRPDISFGYNF